MNNCPNCGLIRGQHSSVLQGCMCQWQMQAQPKREWVGLTDELEALFTNIDHAISSGAWNVQKGSQTWEIIEHAKAAHGIKEKNT